MDSPPPHRLHASTARPTCRILNKPRTWAMVMSAACRFFQSPSAISTCGARGAAVPKLRLRVRRLMNPSGQLAACLSGYPDLPSVAPGTPATPQPDAPAAARRRPPPRCWPPARARCGPGTPGQSQTVRPRLQTTSKRARGISCCSACSNVRHMVWALLLATNSSLPHLRARASRPRRRATAGRPRHPAGT